MGRTDASTGEHRDREFGHHAHIDGDNIALGDAFGFEDIGEFGDFVLEVFVGERALVDWCARIIDRLAFPDDCRVVAVTLFNLSIDTVVADICFAAIEPFGVGGVPFEHGVPLFEPMKIFRDVRPESFWVIDGFFVHLVVLIKRGNQPFARADIRSRRRIENAVFLKDGFDCAVCILI